MAVFRVAIFQNGDTSNVEFAKFLGLYEKIKCGAIKLTSEQAGNWRKLMEKNAKPISQLVKLNAEASELNRLLKEFEDALACVMSTRDEIGNDISCVIDAVTGQTTMQTMRSTLGVEMLSGKSGSDIRDILQKVDSYKARLFSDDTGAFDWKFKKPEST